MARKFKSAVQLDSGLLIPAGAGAGMVLTSDASGNATWATPTGAGQAPQVRVFHNATQSIGAGAAVQLLFNSERYDLGTGTEQHSTATNTSRLTCRQAGLYSIFGHISWSGPVTGQIAVLLNSTTLIAVSTTGATTQQSIQTDYRLIVGDFVELRALPNVAATVQASGNFSPEFGWHWVSA